MEAACSELQSLSPVLLIQGEIGGVVASVKVAAENKLIEAGSTIIEGMDRLFKIYWILNMAYAERSANALKFCEYHVYRIRHGKKISPTVLELCRYLGQ